MIKAIQQAYYRRAMNPSDLDVLLQLAVELNLDQTRFMQLLQSDAVEERLQQEIALAAVLGISSFPSLMLESEMAGTVLNIPIDYRSTESMLRIIGEQIHCTETGEKL